ncbi:MAG: hypothetical protein ACRYF2_04050 [Janthinobacterium lividum]
MMDPAETAARAFFNSAGGSYEMPTPAAPTAAAAIPVPVAPAPAVVPSVPAALPAAVDQEPVSAADIYAPVLTRGSVDWTEPTAEPGQFDLQAPYGLLDQSDEVRAALARLRDGLAAAGAGVTVARELFGDAIRAAQDTRWVVPREQAETQLRQHFGARYDAQVGAAQALVQRAAARCPKIIPFLEQTGLGNSPEFIRKLAVAAGKRRNA